MQVFKLFFKVTRSKIGIGILYTAIFFAICFPMVNASEEKVDFEDTSLSLYVRDEDQTEASKALVAELEKKHHITKRQLNNQELMDAMYYSLIDYSLVIPKGYAKLLGSTDKADLDKELFEEFHLRDGYATAMMNVYLQVLSSAREELLPWRSCHYKPYSSVLLTCHLQLLLSKMMLMTNSWAFQRVSFRNWPLWHDLPPHY